LSYFGFRAHAVSTLCEHRSCRQPRRKLWTWCQVSQQWWK